ncbi:MAG: M23 family metallopeptidase [Clostridiaceae bacterium]
MINKRRSRFAIAFILAITLAIVSIFTYTKAKAMDTQVNNITLSEGTAASTASIEEDEIKIITYTVKADDSIESIASAYNLKVQSIAGSNSLTTDSVLKEGQVIEFPSIDGVIYKIKSGETLWDLASLNNIDFNEIVEVNKLESPEKLKLDQKIIMPGVETVKSVTTKTEASNTTLSRGGSVPAKTNYIGSLPVSGRITSPFGPRWGKLHTGIDIAASVGTNVYASMSGKVIFSGWNGGYGNLVIIDHGNGLQSYYAHNSKLLVKVGQTVAKGDHIAESGSTGNSTGPHCHFEIRKNGVAVNPLNYVR